MADIILSRRQIKLIINNEQIAPPYSTLEDRAYLPVALAIDAIEKEKKSSEKMPSELKRVIERVSEYASLIPLSSRGLYEAMSNPDFSAKYTNRSGNPIEMATEASAYEYDGWWERAEILDSFIELSWT